MAVDLELSPKTKRPAGQPCCEPVVYPNVEREHATRMAEVAKALGDPVRLQLVDVLRKHAGKVCVCELVPLFDISQPTLSHHLKKLRQAGIVDSERLGQEKVRDQFAPGAGRDDLDPGFAGRLGAVASERRLSLLLCLGNRTRT